MTQGRTLLSLVIVLILSVLPAGQSGARAASDEETVRNTVNSFAESFNRHDAEAFAALYAPDADFVDIAAYRYKGRQQIQAHTAFAFGTVSQDSVKVTLPPQVYGALKTVIYRFDSVDVRFMNKDVAVAHVAWTQLGDARFKDKPRQGMLTLIVARDGNRWVFNAGHNSQRPRPN